MNANKETPKAKAIRIAATREYVRMATHVAAFEDGFRSELWQYNQDGEAVCTGFSRTFATKAAAEEWRERFITTADIF